MTIKPLAIIGAASGRAAQDQGCSDGPRALSQSSHFDQTVIKNYLAKWQAILASDPNKTTLVAVEHWCQDIALETVKAIQNQHQFLVIGGDHSCAIGTWSGAHQVLNTEGDLGLIWIDAHMDSHTFETSESKAIHGMPLAALLGFGDFALTGVAHGAAKLKPANVCLIGIRSFEPGEAELLQSLNVRIYDMSEVKQRGLDVVMREAKALVTKNTAYYGISIDLDAIDPIDAPGVGSPEPDGLNARELCSCLQQFQNDPQLCGFEITEYNPHHDLQHQTEQVIIDLISALKGNPL